MKKILAILSVVAVIIVAGTSMGLSTPVAQLKNKQVACSTTAAQIGPDTAEPNFSALCVQNTSATCVRVGGAGVTSSTGVAVGNGCAAGQVFCADARRAYCAAASSVTVDVVYGEQ